MISSLYMKIIQVGKSLGSVTRTSIILYKKSVMERIINIFIYPFFVVTHLSLIIQSFKIRFNKNNSLLLLLLLLFTNQVKLWKLMLIISIRVFINHFLK